MIFDGYGPPCRAPKPSKKLKKKNDVENEHKFGDRKMRKRNENDIFSRGLRQGRWSPEEEFGDSGKDPARTDL